MTQSHGVQILLDSGHTLVFNTSSQDQANQMVRKFEEGYHRIRGLKTMGDTDPFTGVVWSVLVDKVIGMHTVVVRQQPETYQPMASGTYNPTTKNFVPPFYCS